MNTEDGDRPNNGKILYYLISLHDCVQCRGKLLLKVIHYNIALLPKKVTNYVT